MRNADESNCAAEKGEKATREQPPPQSWTLRVGRDEVSAMH